ncbi:MAG: HAD family hydrolase, partial [Burkholderia sp.]|nr:HAD family hydrolase [Burkholderia sp.]
MRLAKVSAVSFDLDDTLWPFGPSVIRAEAMLRTWLIEHAPNTERVLPTQHALSELREEYERLRPDLAGDFRAMRIGSIQLALARANEDVALTDAAYDVFYAARNRVEFYEDALPALAWLSARFPLIAVTNGNADLRLTGGGEFFRTTLSARAFGFAKPEP